MKSVASIICLLATAASLASAAPTLDPNELAGLLGDVNKAVGQPAAPAAPPAGEPAAQPAPAQANQGIGQSADGLAASILKGNGADIAKSALQLAGSIVGQTGQSIGLAA